MHLLPPLDKFSIGQKYERHVFKVLKKAYFSYVKMREILIKNKLLGKADYIYMI